MNTSKKIVSLIAFAFIAYCTVSCNKVNVGGKAGKGSMTATIDGEKFDASLAVQAVSVSGLFQVTGSNGKVQQMNISIMSYNGVGEYALGGSATAVHKGTGMWTKGLNSQDTYTTQVGLGNGVCKITSDDGKTVEGTFSFTARNTQQQLVNVTEGKFKASY
jgi:hypothetical protein